MALPAVAAMAGRAAANRAAAETASAHAARQHALREALGGQVRMPAQGEKVQSRIGNVTAFAMIIVAALMDLAQFVVSFFHVLPVVGNGIAVLVTWFIASFAAFLFWLWFALHGINYFGGKQAARKVLVSMSMLVVEVIPIIDALPGITSGVVLMIIFSRLEERDFNEQSLQGAVRLARGVAATVGRIPSVERHVPKSYEKWSEKKRQDYENARSRRADILAKARGRRERTVGEQWRDEFDPANENFPQAANDNERAPRRAYDIVQARRPYERDHNTQTRKKGA